jgi:hypothetical protein
MGIVNWKFNLLKLKLSYYVLSNVAIESVNGLKYLKVNF